MRYQYSTRTHPSEELKGDTFTEQLEHTRYAKLRKMIDVKGIANIEQDVMNKSLTTVPRQGSCEGTLWKKVTPQKDIRSGVQLDSSSNIFSWSPESSHCSRGQRYKSDGHGA